MLFVHLAGERIVLPFCLLISSSFPMNGSGSLWMYFSPFFSILCQFDKQPNEGNQFNLVPTMWRIWSQGQRVQTSWLRVSNTSQKNLGEKLLSLGRTLILWRKHSDRNVRAGELFFTWNHWLDRDGWCCDWFGCCGWRGNIQFEALSANHKSKRDKWVD